MQCSVTLESDHNSGNVKMKTINNYKNPYKKVGFASIPMLYVIFIGNMIILLYCMLSIYYVMKKHFGFSLWVVGLEWTCVQI